MISPGSVDITRPMPCRTLPNGTVVADGAYTGEVNMCGETLAISGISSVVMGFSYFNPDTGMEWSESHPINSGECDDAERVELMTLADFHRQYGDGIA